MEIAGTGQRVRVYIGEQDRAPGHHEPLWQTILDLLRTEGAAGATMMRGLAGFGAHSKLHTARLADIAPDLPIIVEWIDGPERIARLLPRVCDLVGSGTVTLEDVQIVKYTHRAPRDVPTATVGDVMTRDVVSVHPDTPLPEVVGAVLDRDFRALPVVDAEARLVGIITNGDLVSRGGLSARLELLAALGQSGALPSEVERRTAAEIMTAPVVSIAPDTPLREAVHVMADKRIKRLPVIDAAGRLVGILSRVDVLRTMGEDYHAPAPAAAPAAPARSEPARLIGELMRTDVPVVRADAQLGEVLDSVTSTRLNRALVVDTERRVLGVISDADLLARLDPTAQSGALGALMRQVPFRSELRLAARDVMESPALSVTAETPVADAVRQMLAARRKVLAITDASGRLLGAVDRADLLRHLYTA
jgi:CBS domain-containing protein